MIKALRSGKESVVEEMKITEKSKLETFFFSLFKKNIMFTVRIKLGRGKGT